MAFYHSIKTDHIPKVSLLPSWDKDLSDAIIYNKVRESRVAAKMLEYETDVIISIIPYSSIRVIGGP